MVADSGVEFGRGLEATKLSASSAEMAVDMYMIVILIELVRGKEMSVCADLMSDNGYDTRRQRRGSPGQQPNISIEKRC